MLNMKDENSYKDKSTVYSEISTEHNNEKYRKTVVALMLILMSRTIDFRFSNRTPNQKVLTNTLPCPNTHTYS